MTGILELQAWIGYHENVDEPFVVAAVSEDEARRLAHEAALEAGSFIDPDEFRLASFYPLDQWAKTPAAKPGRCWTASVAVENAMRAGRGPY